MEQAIRAALKSQYRAAFETVRDAIQQCPDRLWEEPGAMPQFWQIAYHTVFFGHFYMLQKEQDLRPWRKHRRGAPSLKPDGQPAYTKAELLEYLGEVLPPWILRSTHWIWPPRTAASTGTRSRSSTTRY
jgi:hypothetical protein